jgi:hypothetical protein
MICSTPMDRDGLQGLLFQFFLLGRSGDRRSQSELDRHFEMRLLIDE